jgi:hypothetical protein
MRPYKDIVMEHMVYTAVMMTQVKKEKNNVT